MLISPKGLGVADYRGRVVAILRKAETEGAKAKRGRFGAKARQGKGCLRAVWGEGKAEASKA